MGASSAENTLSFPADAPPPVLPGRAASNPLPVFQGTLKGILSCCIPPRGVYNGG